MAKTLLRAFVSFSLLGVLVWFMRDEIPKIAEAIAGADKGLIAGAAALFFASTLVISKRLELLFAAEDAPLGFAHATRLTYVGYFFNNFLPSSVGGDIVKAMCAAKVTGKTVKSVTSVLMDRIFGLFTFILLPSVTFLFVARQVEDQRVPLIIYGFLGFAVFVMFLLFNRAVARRFGFVESLLRLVRLDEKARKLYDGLHGFRRHRFAAAAAVGLSFAGQAMSIYVTYLLAAALGAKPDFLRFFMLIPVIHLVSMFPISLNGLGVREGAFVAVLQGQIGTSNAIALSILYLFLLLILSVAGYIVYLVRPDYHIQLKRAAETAQAEGL